MDPRIHTLPDNRAKLGKPAVVNRCPFGCEGKEIQDKTGYCRHLVGFTIDGLTMERRGRFRNKEGGRRFERTLGVKYGENQAYMPSEGDELDERIDDRDTECVPQGEPVLSSDVITPGQSEGTPTRRVYRLMKGEIPRTAAAQRAADSSVIVDMLVEQSARQQQQIDELLAERDQARSGVAAGIGDDL